MLSGLFDLDVQELCRPCNKCTISVRWFTSIKDIKDILRQKFNVPSSRMSLFCISNPKSLRNQTTLHDLGIEQSGHLLRVVINMTSAMSFQLLLSKDIDVDLNCRNMVSQVRQGLERSQIPGKTDLFDCTGGVYFMKATSGEKIAVFKPNDEEQGMPNNPKGHAGNGEEGLRPFFRPGQGYIRETAAYLFDYKNFCQVPPTTIVHCEHACFNYPVIQGQGVKQRIYPKVGSLQSFVHASDTFEDISPSLIGTLELQKIAILDIRLLNCDRNSSNILAIRKTSPNSFHNGTRCRRDSRSSSMGSYTTDENGFMCCDEEFNPFQEEEENASTSYASVVQGGNDLYELIPIDHGYCIPSRLRIDELDWIWFYCPQIARPVDPEIRRYVASLNIEELITQLESQLKIEEYSSFLLRLSHRVLSCGIEAGLTLYDIAQIIARMDEDRPSLLEKAIKVAEENAHRTIEARSNRLNSRGLNSSAHSLSSFGGVSAAASASSSTPVRVTEETGDVSPRLTTIKRLSRVVQSAANLSSMGGNDSSKSLTSSPRFIANKPLRKLMSVSSDAASYLSSENIEKLQQSSPHSVPPKFPNTFNSVLADSSACGLNSSRVMVDSPVGDFYLAELFPSSKAAPSSHFAVPTAECDVPSVSLGLSRSLVHSGDKLRVMHSVDTASRLQPNIVPDSITSQQESATTSAFVAASAASSSKQRMSYLRTGVVSDSTDVWNDDLNYTRTEPIMIALRDSSYSDTTTSSESSKEGGCGNDDDGFSPKSFGEGFFSCERLVTSYSPVDDENSLAHVTAPSKPFLERPFPPRAELSAFDNDMSHNSIDKLGVAAAASRDTVSRTSSGGNTSDEDNTDGELLIGEKTLKDGVISLLGREASTSSFSSLRSAGLSNLHRIASFNAFESPAIYEHVSDSYKNQNKLVDRQLNSLRREQRKAVAMTSDFQELRLKYAYEAITVIISREVKRKSAAAASTGNK